MTELDLPDNPALPQLFQLPDAQLLMWQQVLDLETSRQLLAHLVQLPWQKPAIWMFGRMLPIPRQQVWMGDPHCSYRYSGVLFSPEPWTPILLQVTAMVSQLTGHPFNCVLLNRYDGGGEHMGWHSDDEPELGESPVIASLSLGQSRRFDLRHKDLGCQLQLKLADGDLLLMAGECQRFWQHALPKQARAEGTRYNLTFRYIAADRRNCEV